MYVQSVQSVSYHAACLGDGPHRYPRARGSTDFVQSVQAHRHPKRRRNCVLPPGAQQIEGSLMHQALVAQTPEGKLRAWVEHNYTHVPLRMITRVSNYPKLYRCSE